MDSDPNECLGKIWSWSYFFVNKKLKKILYFGCYSRDKDYHEEDNKSTDSDEIILESNEKNKYVHFYPKKNYDDDDDLELEF
jgi:hypothetical protein